MTSLNLALRDSMTMLRRNLRHQLRYLSLTVFQLAIPVILLLLFVYVFGATMGAGLAGAAAGRAEYLNYIVPAIIMITVAGVAQVTAISVATDMTEGVIARFRTMAIARVSVLTGHVAGTFIQTMVVVPAVVGVALLLGYRTTAGPLEWLAAYGVVALITFAVIWLAVAMGLTAKSVETASNLPMPLMLLPFFGSGFVPTQSLPTALRWFAEYQPFTPVMDLLRSLLTGGPIGDSAALTGAWSVVIALTGYLWARRRYAAGS